MVVMMQYARISPLRTVLFARSASPFGRLLQRSAATTHISLSPSTATSSWHQIQKTFSTSPSIIAPFRRNASTDSAAPAQPAQASSASTEHVLTWNEFLHLRRIRRYYNLGASVGTSLTTFITGMGYMSQQNLSALGQQFFGVDPFVLLGICGLGFWGLGWLLGPLVGTGIFQLLYRSRVRDMAIKEKDFFQRIKKYRVDPSTSSVQNPVPDFYGEKITSVAGYRRWLKDQRAFNRKRQSFV